ncbi:taste receptor type 1 member 1-like [Spinachia spinachia]
MKHFLASLSLLGAFLHASAQRAAPASEFLLEGDYLLGGIFDIHHTATVYHDRPEAIDCSSKPLILSSYRRFQLMRFSVEEINNSTDLLPNVSLGYEIFDHCSEVHNFPGILKLLSVDSLIQPRAEPHKNLSKVIAVVGPFSSSDTLTVAPLFMMDLVPMIDSQTIPIIIVFARDLGAELLIKSAIELNVTNKVWIAVDTWSLNEKLLKEKRIKQIGTVLGVSQPVVTIPGFSDFIYHSKTQTHCENAEQSFFCNQVSNSSNMTPEEILNVDPSFNFPVYSAVYAIAHALHNTLQCGTDSCNGNITVFPYMVLSEMKKSNFTLLNQRIQFDVNGEPTFGSYSIVFWNQSGEAEEIGFSKFYPSQYFFINSSSIHWFTKGEVPTSMCSPECAVGFLKRSDSIHKCCFNCEICPNGTYINITENPYECINCQETEWSAAGSTSCDPRELVFVLFTDVGAVLILVAACVLVGLIVAMSVLFAINYNTPVVRSAGGPMCFLIFGCLCLSSVSVFFYFGKPTASSCVLRFLPFLLFYSVCLACFVVRSFQIVSIFKMAAKFPKLHSVWMKYHGQWLFITLAFVTQALLLLVGYTLAPPNPHDETLWFPDKTVRLCEINIKASVGPAVLLVSLCFLCFVFSYMGKDLPKNYNEAKAITFCLLLLILTWIIFSTGYLLYKSKDIQTLNALAVLSSLYSFLLFYFLPKCYIIIFQSHRNTQEYFQGLIQNYTKTISN